MPPLPPLNQNAVVGITVQIVLQELLLGLWAGVESSWTRLTVWNSAFVGDDARFPHRRFINHASAAHQNVALCTDSGRRFGRSHAFYAKTDIPAHSELYFSYGAGYWSARGIEPEDPAQE